MLQQERNLSPNPINSMVREGSDITPCQEAAELVKIDKMAAHIGMLLKMGRGGRPCDGCDD